MAWVPSIRFDRHEVAGAFGDLGTDFPLLVGLILVAGLDGTSVLVVFGLMQIATALHYGIPMPVQPLKAMAAIVITQKVAAPVLYGAGLAIGAIMLLLTLTGLLDLLAKIIPKAVIRGIQFGLGLKLAMVALQTYVVGDGISGGLLAAAGFLLAFVFFKSRVIPAALLLVALGLVYSFGFKLSLPQILSSAGFALPKPSLPTWADIAAGFFLLTLPQLPLSLGNSVFATRQIALDLFPDRAPSLRKIGVSYALMNLLSPLGGGVPVCHGSGGMAGHAAFGGKTGGSVALYGLFFVVLGLFFGSSFVLVSKIFPLPILGVLLLFEALALMLFLRDLDPSEAPLALFLGLLAALLPYGFLLALLVGVPLFWALKKRLLSFPSTFSS